MSQVHAQARTTPRTRAQIKASPAPLVQRAFKPIGLTAPTGKARLTKIVRMRTVRIHTFEEIGLVGAPPRAQEGLSSMGFELPKEITARHAGLDALVGAEIAPLQREHMQFFDHRREQVRTDWERAGRPLAGRRALIAEMARRADKAGRQRLGLPKPCGGQAATNLMITAGSEDVQMHRVAQYLFGFTGKQATQ